MAAAIFFFHDTATTRTRPKTKQPRAGALHPPNVYAARLTGD
jgi:hypothetical protein